MQQLKMLPIFLLLTAPLAAEQGSVNIDVSSPGPKIGSHMYGIFLEEINHGIDGGLYAELVRNRAFDMPHRPGARKPWYEPPKGHPMMAPSGRSGSALDFSRNYTEWQTPLNLLRTRESHRPKTLVPRRLSENSWYSVQKLVKSGQLR